MLTLKKIFKVKIGYSDHTNSKLVGLIAVCLGASIVEKHITLNKSFVGPDHKASFLPSEFKELVNLAKDAKIILGKEDKFISNSEKVNIYYARKSLVAKKNILKGQRFNLDNITAKRPFGGISPMKIKKIIGKRSRYFFRKDDLIKL
jgi:sialic acid synthase SpsE